MLTDLAVRKAQPKEKPYKLFDQGGLYLLVTPDGSKYWRFKFRSPMERSQSAESLKLPEAERPFKQKDLALGVYPQVSMAEAREGRDAAKKLLRDGKDPSIEKKQKRLASVQAAANTFKAIALEWMEVQKNNWTEKHAVKILTSFEQNVFPDLGNRPIKEITAADMLRVLKKIEARGALDVARRVLRNCRNVFGYAIVTMRCDTNPADPYLAQSLKVPEKKHFAALKLKELPAFLQKLREYPGSEVTKAAVRTLMLTFVRTKEMRFAKWPEFDLDKGEWIVPGERMKGKRTQRKEDHYVPLSSQAVAELRALFAITGENPDGYVFPNPVRGRGGVISENCVLQALYRMGLKGKMTGHGFRTVASSALNEMGWNPDAVERQLAHIERNKTRGAYNRAEYLDERRRMMQAWGSYIEAIETGSNVVPFRAGERA